MPFLFSFDQVSISFDFARLDQPHHSTDAFTSCVLTLQRIWTTLNYTLHFGFSYKVINGLIPDSTSGLWGDIAVNRAYSKENNILHNVFEWACSKLALPQFSFGVYNSIIYRGRRLGFSTSKYLLGDKSLTLHFLFCTNYYKSFVASAIHTLCHYSNSGPVFNDSTSILNTRGEKIILHSTSSTCRIGHNYLWPRSYVWPIRMARRVNRSHLSHR